MASLAEIRAKLLAQEKGKSGGIRDNAIYPHWNIPENSTATVRFLPDGNTSNDFFWIERQMIKIPFSGVKGGDENKPVIVQVPCVEMWGDKCPIHDEIRPWFKDPSMEDLARKYWKKRSYLFQGFVVDSSLTEDEVPENPIRRFTISPQIFKIIQSALMDPDFGEDLPTDFEQGIDFKIVKTQKGQYADYSTSNWARKARGLTQIERDAIATHGLFDLNDFMPKKPSIDSINAMFAMFEASVEGQLYDLEKFGEHYRPFGLDMPNSGSSTVGAGSNDTHTTITTAQIANKLVDAELIDVVDNDFDIDVDDEPVVVNPTTEKAKDAKDILAAIRARKEA